MSKYIFLQETELDEKIERFRKTLLTLNKEKEKELKNKGETLLCQIDRIRYGTKKLDPIEIEDLYLIVKHSNESLLDRNDPKKSTEHAKTLANLSIRTSVNRKSLGKNLLIFGCAVLVVAGLLLAIPTGGTSLLLSAIGGVGLAGAVGIGTGIAATGVIGAAALADKNSPIKELNKSFRSFREKLNETLTEKQDEVSSQEAEQLLPQFDSVSEVANQDIINAINTDHNSSVEEFKKFPRLANPLTTKDILDVLKHNIKLSEAKKHPSPNWIYTRISGREKEIIKIKYDPDAKLTDQVLNDKTKYSIITRKLSIIGGVLTLLDSDSYLTSDPNKKEKIRAHLATLSQQIIDSNDKSLDPKTELNSFVKDLASNLEAYIEDKSKNIIRDIREAERYFVAEHNKNQVLIVETAVEGKTILQVDIGLNHQLSDAQKESYLAIHKEKAQQPTWFKALSKAEQEWYENRIPQFTDTNEEKVRKWSEFQSLFKSSAMTHTPGIPNARINYLMQKDGEKLETINASIKSATPVSYEMSLAERNKHSRDNAIQLIGVAQKLASKNHTQLWGDFFNDSENKPKPPILVQSLLSEKIDKFGIQLVKADADLIAGQRTAMHPLKSKSHEIMYHNDGTNAYSRGNKIKMQGNAEFVHLVDLSKNFLNEVYRQLDKKNPQAKLAEVGKKIFDKPLQNQELEDFIEKIFSSTDLTNKQKQSVITILRVLNEYHHEKQESPLFSRNKAEYIIALKKLLVESMGGVVTNNCKSGKDRTGQSEVYQHAMTLYSSNEGSKYPLLKYTEEGVNRTLFCRIAAILNGSQKIQEAAAFNTPGCVGTKSTAVSKIIDDDIRNHSLFSELHELGCCLAGMNKPPLFSADEKNASIESKSEERSDLKNRLNAMKPGGYVDREVETLSMGG